MKSDNGRLKNSVEDYLGQLWTKARCVPNKSHSLLKANIYHKTFMQVL